ncbi:MAG: hypothetical protein LAP85_20290 [Acidobacteriia bacterium]|nr:hypothetical protein [Terriglobia bacterium]
MDEPQRKAYHEAAHAVAWVQFQGVFEYVTILRDSEYEGRVKWTERPLDKRKDIILCLAGYAADIKVSPESESSARNGARDDFAEAEFSSQLINVRYSEADWMPLARRFVDENWKAVTAVAAELLRRGTLSSREVERLVRMADGRENV